MRTYILLIGFIGILFLSACGGQDTFGDYSYSDFQRIEDWDDVNDLGHDDFVFVFVYNRDYFGGLSTGTEMVSEDILKFGAENPMGYTMYRVNQSDVTGIRPSNVQRRDPKVLIVRHGEVVDKFYGALPIFNFLEAHEEDRYIYPALILELEKDAIYEPYTHFNNWRDIRDMARDSSGLVYIYAQDAEGRTEETKAIDDVLLDYIDSEDITFFLGNGHTMIGLVPAEMTPDYPSLHIVENNVIVESFTTVEEIMDFIE